MKLLIADDHAVVRSALKFMINAQKDMEVIGDAADGTEAFLFIESIRPDIVLMDLSMPPGENGLLTTKRITEAFPETKVILLTMHDEEAYITQALQAGAQGYIMKNSSEELLLDAIRSVMGGQIIIDPVFNYSSKQIEQLKRADASENIIERLSKREKEILPLIALGYGNKEIAERLFISAKTVEVHKSHIMKKLEMKKFSDLLRFCVKEQLIDL